MSHNAPKNGPNFVFMINIKKTKGFSPYVTKTLVKYRYCQLIIGEREIALAAFKPSDM